jgi:hypothetical protein
LCAFSSNALNIIAVEESLPCCGFCCGQMMSTINETATTTATKRLFLLGNLYATPGALEVLSEAGQGAAEFLSRHQRGDLGEEDKAENEFSVDKRLRIFSAYHTHEGVKLWVITEADRSATTILLPSEY